MIFRKILIILVLASILIIGLFKFELYVLEKDERQIAAIVSEKAEAESGVHNRIVIAVGIGVIESIAADLVNGTGIIIVPAFKSEARIADQKLLISARSFNPKLNPEIIDACIDIRSSSSCSNLFSYLREKNIRIVEIDCANPVESNRRSVSLVERPAGGASARGAFYQNIWLSPMNAIRMVDLMSEDISKLAPEWEGIILQNQIKLKRSIVGVEAEYLSVFSEYENTDVIALSDDFVYLTNSFQIFVADYLDDDGREWSKERLEDLTDLIVENDVKVIIHKWEPHSSVTKAITDAGAKLVILNPMDKTSLKGREYTSLLCENLEKLRKVFH